MSEPSRKLSTEEVNALMEGLRSGDLSTSTSLKDSSAIEYKTFNFGSDDLSLLGDYYALRLINERFARTVRGSLGEYRRRSRTRPSLWRKRRWRKTTIWTTLKK